MNTASLLLPEEKPASPEAEPITAYPHSAESFKELSRNQQELFVQQFIKPPRSSIKAFIFLPNFAIMVIYQEKYSTVFKPALITPTTFDNALAQIRTTTGPKQIWSYLTDKKVQK